MYTRACTCGVCERWCEGEVHILLDFCREPEMAHFYKDHISAITQRTNTYNKRRYCDDDAIMMWDVFNEPRCPGAYAHACVGACAATGAVPV